MEKVGADKTSAPRGGEAEFDAASMCVQPGDVIAGKYEVIRLLGSGGMAFVVAARHIELDEIVAIKFLRSESLVHRDVAACFVREARAAVKIKSEHVARVFDVGALPDGAPFIVMEYLDGKDLRALLREEETLPVERVAEYVMQACEALAAAHALGMVHRDIKPENLFVVNRTQGLELVKVLDFGISKSMLTGSAIDQSGLQASSHAMGTPLYMSPEQIRGSRSLDARADIWSLGCVLFELLSGHPPFDAPSIMLLIATILEHPIPRLREGRPDLPAALESIVDRCLEKDPNLRFEDVGELAEALSRFAPARARISVERCKQLVQNGGSIDVPIELSSDPPPSAPHSNAAMTLPQVGIDPLPATVAPRRGSKLAMLAGACILLAAGAVVLRRSLLAPWLGGPAWLGGAAVHATSAFRRTPPSIATAAPAIAEPATTATPLEVATAPAPAESGLLPNALEPEVTASSLPDAAAPAQPSARPPLVPRRRFHAPSNAPQPNSPEDTDVGY
jgi:serine/threonine-protein kinase